MGVNEAYQQAMAKEREEERERFKRELQEEQHHLTAQGEKEGTSGKREKERENEERKSRNEGPAERNEGERGQQSSDVNANLKASDRVQRSFQAKLKAELGAVEEKAREDTPFSSTRAQASRLAISKANIIGYDHCCGALLLVVEMSLLSLLPLALTPLPLLLSLFCTPCSRPFSFLVSLMLSLFHVTFLFSLSLHSSHLSLSFQLKPIPISPPSSLERLFPSLHPSKESEQTSFQRSKPF